MPARRNEAMRLPMPVDRLDAVLRRFQEGNEVEEEVGEGGEWRDREWTIADPVPERAAVVGRVRRTFARERFALTVEETRSHFQQVLDPFAILPRAGVFLSNGKNFETMATALLDLWNYTERRDLGGRCPVEVLRRVALATGAAPSRLEVRDSLFCASAHNSDLLRDLERPRPR